MDSQAAMFAITLEETLLKYYSENMVFPKCLILSERGIVFLRHYFAEICQMPLQVVSGIEVYRGIPILTGDEVLDLASF